MTTANTEWCHRLAKAIDGHIVRPRGMPCYENLHATVVIDMEHSLLTVKERHLSYKFAAVEALWILDGDNRLAPLLPYNKRMAEFSDDGTTLAGAYGPRLVPQIPFVVNSLVNDRDTRQAVASIWKPSPMPSRDIPCTLALTFMVRGNYLHCHAFMRSSDIWLGLPYDLFAFSQVALVVLARYNMEGGYDVRPGKLHLTAASSHLYETNLAAAQTILDAMPVSKWHLPHLRNHFTEADVRLRLAELRSDGEKMLVLT